MVGTPCLDESVVVLDGARVVGNVTMGPGCSVWYNAVIRAEQDVVIGGNTNVQDNVVIHVSEGHPVHIGDGVSIGHGAIVHGCTIGNNTLIGMGAIVLDGATVGNDCIIGAGSVVTQGMVIPDGSGASGSPARVRRTRTEHAIAANRHTAQSYVELAQQALA
ncbi:MAG: gamma carbonic anhydrase family protein [Atopobiaceae bacterium]|nr:gamma carbonic anhydrase family protein [Atopobiaceae bacterium]